MNVTEKIKELYEHVQKAHELMQDLQGVDWSSVEEDALEVGKLCKFSDHADFRRYVVGPLTKILRYANFPYYLFDTPHKYCRRVTKKELEKML